METLRLLQSWPESLVWRGDLGHEISDPGFLRQRRKGSHAFLQSDRAGVVDPAVDQHHAFLAGVGIDAGEPKRKRRIDLAPKRAQAVELVRKDWESVKDAVMREALVASRPEGGDWNDA